MKRLYYAWGWWRAGLRTDKAWQLAGHNVRKSSYRNEIVVFCALFAAYAFVGWNDATASLDNMRDNYTSAMTEKNKAEIALVDTVLCVHHDVMR